MSYAFHYIKSIVKPYLHYLLMKSRRCQDHLDHLRKNFMQCRYYNICLNPHKRVFVLELDQLLGFIVANNGIQVDPLKVKAITNLPLPCTILQLQSLQGKAIFLRRFITNYVEIPNGFMRLLKKGVSFVWDD